MNTKHLLVGTSDGLVAITWSSATGHAKDSIELEGEWITSIYGVDQGHTSSALITTRTGKIFRWTPRKVSLITQVPYRLWFIARTRDGEYVAGGSSTTLLRFSSTLTRLTRETVGIGRDWRSHSGQSAHINAYVELRSRKSYIAAEVGGVAERTGEGWIQKSNGLDPDVHKIVPGSSDTGCLFATTGTGLFEYDPLRKSWIRLPSPRLKYLQALLSRRSDGALYVSAAAMPFGRHRYGGFGGNNKSNQFGIFCRDRSGSWFLIPCESNDAAGILSKAMAFSSRDESCIVAGDVMGRIFESTSDAPLSQIAETSGLIECIEFARPVP